MSDDQALAILPASPDELVLQDIAGQLAERSRRVYRHDAKAFATWMMEQGLAPQTLTKSHIIAYRSYLQARYTKATAARMLSVTRQLLAEQVDRQHIEYNPATGVRGFKGENETTHVALTNEEAQTLLDIIDTTTLLGQRDLVLILFLLRTGIRRSEAAALKISDLTMRQGHHIAIIEHGKGDKRRIVKVPVEVWREIEEHLEARHQYHTTRMTHLLDNLERERDQLPEEEYQAKRNDIVLQHTVTEHDGLFVRVRRGNHPTREAITDKAIEKIVKHYAELIKVDDLTPHGLRASFITFALEANAPLPKVQYAAGHSDPRTTERYQKRKLNLDENAVDFVKINRKQTG